MNDNTIRKDVRKAYGAAATRSRSCCGGSHASETACTAQDGTGFAGYTREQLDAIPKGADLGLGCGNPTALAELRHGETVVDLGSGAGIDIFLASQAIGPEGHAIGVDMTAEMLDRARENALRNGIDNVEFRLGEIENLPIADGTADVILSNCVINLSPDKPRVFSEAFRVLKPGGRMMISDIVLLKDLPEPVLSSKKAYAACIAGAVKKPEYLDAIRWAGFKDVEILSEKPAGAIRASDAEDLDLNAISGEDAVQYLAEAAAVDYEGYEILAVSLHVRAIKPA